MISTEPTAATARTSVSEKSVGLPGIASLWAHGTGHPEVRVAVLDGPVDLGHPCFHGARLSPLETLVAGSEGGQRASEHGTHVASLIFGQHGSPVAGVAPGCHGLILPVLGSQGPSLGPCSQLDLARAILQALEAGARVINISAGQLEPSGQAQPHLDRAVRLCAESGALIVAAAGNEGCDCLHIPAALPAVLAVGAMDGRGMPLAFSNWGEAYRSQGILVPGEHIPGAVPGGGIARRSGTSFATALMSGLVALLLSLQIRRGGKGDPAAVRRAILASAIPCEEHSANDCRRLLAGRLDIPGALALLTKGDLKPMSHPSMPESNAPPTIESPPVAEEVAPSGCGKPAPRAYALGTLAYDFSSPARQESFLQAGLTEPRNPKRLLAHLKKDPASATAITWLLEQEATPIYAIRGLGPFAARVYETLRDWLDGQLQGEVEQVAIPGEIAGSETLASGQTVPVLWPEVWGMASWSTATLTEAIAGSARGEVEAPAPEELRNFLDRVYYEIRNLGLAPQERALNFAATQAFQVEAIYAAALQAGLKLDTIGVEKTPVCRPNSDCWDVKLTFFDPSRRLDRAREVYRFTVDVSEVIPVTVGKVRHWHIY